MRSPRLPFLIGALTVLAALAAFDVPVGYLPGERRAIILITIERRSASPEEMERTIAIPLEDELAALNGLIEQRAIIEQGRLRLQLRFDPSIDIDRAYLQVAESLDRLYSILPRDTQRPRIGRSSLESQPIFIIAFPPQSAIDEQEARRLFENVDGTGRVVTNGFERLRVMVRFDPKALAAAGLRSTDIASAIQHRGIIESFGRNQEPELTLDNRFESVEDIGFVTVGDGSRQRRLHQVAMVHLESDRDNSLSRINGERHGVVSVYRSGTARLLDLSRRLRRLSSRFPDANVVHDLGGLIERRVGGVLLIVAINLLIVSAFAIAVGKRRFFGWFGAPIGLLFTIALLRLSGQGVDLYSMAGVSVGQALVAANLTIKQRGTATLPFLLIGATISPVLLASDDLRNMVAGMAIGALAITLTGALWQIGMGRSRQSPTTVVSVSQRSRRMRVAQWTIALVSFAGIASLPGLRFGLFSPEESSRLHFSLQFPDGATEEQIDSDTRFIEDVLTPNQEIETLVVTSEYDVSRFTLTLSNRRAFPRLRNEILDRSRGLGETFAYFPDDDGRETVSILIRGAEHLQIRETADLLARPLGTLPGVDQVTLQYREALPAYAFIIDAEQSRHTGIDAERIGSALRWALSQPVAAKWIRPDGEIDIQIEAMPDTHREAGIQTAGLQAVLRLPVTGTDGTAIPVGQLIRVEEHPRLASLQRHNRRPSTRITLQVDPARRAEVINSIEPLIDGLRSSPQTTIRVESPADANAEAEAGQWLLLAALSICCTLLLRGAPWRKVFIRIAAAWTSIAPFLLFLRMVNRALTMPMAIGLIGAALLAIMDPSGRALPARLLASITLALLLPTDLAPLALAFLVANCWSTIAGRLCA